MLYCKGLNFQAPKTGPGRGIRTVQKGKGKMMKKARLVPLLLALAMLLSGCGKSKEEEDEGGPHLGDTMHTCFFDFTVNSAYVCGEYEGYVPEEGNQMLVAEVTVKNPGDASVEMYDTDFQAQWGSEDEDDFRVPITTDPDTNEELDTLSDKQLPSTYTLGIDGERTGLLVFEVPAGHPDYSISYQEMFSDETTGETYFVYFTPEVKEAKEAK